MEQSESVEQRLVRIEQKVDRLLSQAVSPIGHEAGAPVKRPRGRTGRVLLGFLIMIISLVWLGQNFGIEWLGKLRILPLVLIAFGLYLAFGGQER